MKLINNILILRYCPPAQIEAGCKIDFSGHVEAKSINANNIMSNKNAIPNLTSQDVEAALHAHALNLEAQFPETDKDIAAFFKTLDKRKCQRQTSVNL